MPTLAPGGSAVGLEDEALPSQGSAPAEILELNEEHSAEDLMPIAHDWAERQEHPQQDPRSESSDEGSLQFESVTSSQQRNSYGVDSGDIPTMYELYGVHTEELPTYREMGIHTDSDSPHHREL